MPAYLEIFSEAFEADHPPVGQSLLGKWEYEGTGIPAVGARDLSLEEKLGPLMIARPGEEPIAVLIPYSEVEKDPQLRWALQAGRVVEGEEGPLLQIPYPVWQEHAGENAGVWLPERDGAGIARRLAISEREFRFAQREVEAARMRRNCVVVLATHLGLSRREVGENLGLSLGRVQQLNENPPTEVLAVVEELVEAAVIVAKNLGRRPCPREDIPRPRAMSSAEHEQLVDTMLLLGLLEESPDGVQLTPDGAVLAEGSAARKPRKSNPKRERAGDAAE